MKIINATKIIAVSAVCMLAMPAFAQSVKQTGPVQVHGAWVRATVAGQTSTGAFMRITARSATRLIGVSSPVAGVAEVHEMKMNGNVMTMREARVIDLPAGKPVDFKSGGYHLMLMDLKQPLPAGSTVPLTLKLKDAGGVESSVEMTVPVAKAAPAATAPGAVHSH